VTGEYGRVDEDGSLKIPAAVARQLGFVPGARVKLGRLADRLVLHRPTGHLARIYVEPTTACNLQCRTCMRQVWQEPIGHMPPEPFAALLESVRALDPPPAIVFGGLGEPFMHPRLLDMLRAAKRLPGPVEVITNGLLLDDETIAALIAMRLDTLWVSLDGASPDCYADVRVRGDFGRVMANLERLRDEKIRMRTEAPQIGVSFVAMRRNLGELSEILRLEHGVGARQFLVTHVYPHTEELLAEVLYRRSIGEKLRARSTIRAARMDLDRDTGWVLEQLIKGHRGAQLEDLEALWPSDACPCSTAM
jgi:MoaA/NifB/PqqE/SkfB family radical SAM enzyme